MIKIAVYILLHILSIKKNNLTLYIEIIFIKISCQILFYSKESERENQLRNFVGEKGIRNKRWTGEEGRNVRFRVRRVRTSVKIALGHVNN